MGSLIRPLSVVVLSAIVFTSACDVSEQRANTLDKTALPSTSSTSLPDEIDTPLVASGAWQLKENSAGAAALFGEPESEARFSVSCITAANGEKTLSFYRAANAPENAVTDMDLFAAGINRRIRVSSVETGLPAYSGIVYLTGDNSWLEGLLSADTLTIQLQDGIDSGLTVPVSPELKQVVQTCSAGAAPATEADKTVNVVTFQGKGYYDVAARFV